MKPRMTNTPFTAHPSDSRKETEQCLRGKKTCPLVVALVVAVLVIGLCGSLVGFSGTLQNGTLGEIYQEYFEENPTKQVIYVNKDAMGYPALEPEDEKFGAALEYVQSMNLRRVIGGEKYIGNFDYRQGAISLKSATGQDLEIDMYPTVGYIVISKGNDAMVPSGTDARVYQWDEAFDVEVVLNYLASEFPKKEPLEEDLKS